MKHTEQKGFTKVFDVVFDCYMKYLKESELKTYLKIIRNTIGWGKYKDRMTINYLANQLLLSKRSVGPAIQSLRAKGLIRITDSKGQDVQLNPENFHQCYYTPLFPKGENFSPNARKNVPRTIYSSYNKEQKTGTEVPVKKSDQERLAEILGNSVNEQ